MLQLPDLKINRAVLEMCGSNLPTIGSKLKFKNPIQCEHWRGGKLLAIYDTVNDITTVGINDIFNCYFGGGNQTSDWYVGLISAASFSAVASTDTMASHSGWVKYTTITASTWAAWGPGSASAGSITNGTAVSYTISGSGSEGTVEGVFIVGNTSGDSTANALADTAGILWATALFATPVSVNGGDTLKITYTVTGS